MVVADELRAQLAVLVVDRRRAASPEDSQVAPTPLPGIAPTTTDDPTPAAMTRIAPSSTAGGRSRWDVLVRVLGRPCCSMKHCWCASRAVYIVEHGKIVWQLHCSLGALLRRRNHGPLGQMSACFSASFGH